MSLIAIPNVSEGRDHELVGRLADAAASGGAKVLDVHSDEFHNRSVFTIAGEDPALVEGMVSLAREAARAIDLTLHTGVHPRLGALDVCPFVPHGIPMDRAVEAARKTAARIGNEAGIPVYLYERATMPSGTRSLPDLRKGGMEGLIGRSREIPPDFGPSTIDPATGVVCVGARDVLIAFNVWLRGSVSIAQQIAAELRTSAGGPPGVRALGLQISPEMSQVSMNLTRPEVTGIEEAFAAVRDLARELSGEVEFTEIIGLVPERYLPDPGSEAARRSISPGHSLESVLGSI